MLVLTSLATILLVWKCARLLGRDPRAAVALVGLNPIVLVWGLGGDHNDFLMMFFIMLGFYLLLLARARARGPSDAAGALDGTSAGGPVAAQIGGPGSIRAPAPAACAVAGWLAPLSMLDAAPAPRS